MTLINYENILENIMTEKYFDQKQYIPEPVETYYDLFKKI